MNRTVRQIHAFQWREQTNFLKNTQLNFDAAEASAFVIFFLAVLLEGGAEIWQEAAPVTIILLLAAANLAGRKLIFEQKFMRLLAPIFLLGIYALWQGIARLFESRGMNFPAAGADAAQSFWCAVKFMAASGFFVWLVINFRQRVLSLALVLIAAGNFFALFGIFRYLFQENFPNLFRLFLAPELTTGIGFGTFLNQNHFAFLMLLTLGLNGGFLFAENLEKKYRLLFFVFTAMSWTAIVLTASRGGIISSLIVIFVLTALSFSRKRNEHSAGELLSSLKTKIVAVVLATVFLLAAIILIGGQRVVNRFERLSDQVKIAAEYEDYRRTDVWLAGWKMARDYPVGGIGFGGFRYMVAQYAEISGVTVPEQAHNDYLELLNSGGIIAVVLALCFGCQFAAACRRRKEQSIRSGIWENAASHGAFAAIFGIMLHSCFDFGLQMTANWIFLVGVCVVALLAADGGATEKATGNFPAARTHIFQKIFSLFFFVLACYSFAFGWARLENAGAARSNDSRFTADWQSWFFYDAEFYIVEATHQETRGAFQQAAAILAKAVQLRPADYSLRLWQARLAEKMSDAAESEKNYRAALNLAPFYWQPHYNYGRFLLGVNGRGDKEGLDELKIALRRNRQLSNEIFETVWRQKNGDADAFVEFFAPPASYETVKLANFLINKNEFLQTARVLCRVQDLDRASRMTFVNMLAEKRSFRAAHQVLANDCDRLPEASAISASGNFFAAGDYTESVFDWRVAELPKTIRCSVERAGEKNENYFEFDFAGSSDPSMILLTRTTAVEKNGRYVFSFAYRAEKITSGGLPVLQIFLREPDGDQLLKEYRLAADSGKIWVNYDLTLQTGERAEAVEIRFVRQSCGADICPIFGKLKLGKFSLRGFPDKKF